MVVSGAGEADEVDLELGEEAELGSVEDGAAVEKGELGLPVDRERGPAPFQAELGAHQPTSSMESTRERPK